MQTMKMNLDRHFGIGGPWTCILDEEMLDSGLRLKNTQYLLLFIQATSPHNTSLGVKHTGQKWYKLQQILCVIGARFSKSWSGVQNFWVQSPGPAIPKCHLDIDMQPGHGAHLYIETHIPLRQSRGQCVCWLLNFLRYLTSMNQFLVRLFVANRQCCAKLQEGSNTTMC